MVTIGGYGNSEGEPSETSAYRDAQAALDWVKAEYRIESASVLAHGLSIGGAVAASLARDNPGLHLTLDQTFVNAYEVAKCVAANHFEGYVGHHPTTTSHAPHHATPHTHQIPHMRHTPHSPHIPCTPPPHHSDTPRRWQVRPRMGGGGGGGHELPHRPGGWPLCDGRV